MVHEAEIVSQRTTDGIGIGVDCELMMTNEYSDNRVTRVQH